MEEKKPIVIKAGETFSVPIKFPRELKVYIMGFSFVKIPLLKRIKNMIMRIAKAIP